MAKYVDEAKTAASMAAANAQMEADWDKAAKRRNEMREAEQARARAKMDAWMARRAKK